LRRDDQVAQAISRMDGFDGAGWTIASVRVRSTGQKVGGSTHWISSTIRVTVRAASELARLCS